MELAARRYIRKVLLTHLGLLCLVLLIVGAAVRYLYNSARDQAIDQAKTKQELLARQTGLGIKNYYESVTNVLELLQPEVTATEDESSVAESPTTEPAARSSSGASGARSAQRRAGGGGPRTRQQQEQQRRRITESAAFLRFSAGIWNSIGEKSSLLMVLEPDGALLKVLNSGDGAPDPKRVAQQIAKFVPAVRQTTVSSYLKDAGPGGAHVVCVRLRGRTTRGDGGGGGGGGGANAADTSSHIIMAAIMPISYLEKNLLGDVNRSTSTGALLIDDSGTFVSAANHPEAVGKNLTELRDPRTRQLADHYIKSGIVGTEIFDRAEQLGDTQFRPAMSTIQPVDVLGKKWCLVVSSSLEDVDQIIKPIFRDAVVWAMCVIGAMTAILVSTAMQMIRSRVRLERAQMEMLNRELTQAREIQLHWLPDQPCRFASIDLAAVNVPASHISGDFYNWFELPDGRIVVMVGDVTGHGMAAAFLMATTQLLVRATMPGLCHPGLCLAEVNRQLCMQVFNGQFVTMLVMVMDMEKSTVEIASAGHPPPLVGNGEAFRPLEVEPQLVLGVEPDLDFPTQKIALPRDSTLVLYTDGVLDAQSPGGGRFQIAGLSRSLFGRFDSARAVIDAVVDAVTIFRGEQELADDLTLVAIQLQCSTSRSTGDRSNRRSRPAVRS